MKKIILSFLILIIFSLSCCAITEDRKISLEEALKQALNTNPQMKMAELNTKSAENNIKIAAKFQNPSVGTYQNIGKAAQWEAQQIGGDLIIEILKRGRRKNIAKSDYLTAQNNQKSYEYYLSFEVKKAYIDFLLKKANLNLIKEQAQLSHELLECLSKQADKGQIPKTDVLQSKIAYNKSIMYLNIAKGEVISAQNRFNAVLNSSDINYDTKENTLDNNYKALLAISPKEDKATFAEVKNYALKHRYDLLASESEVESAQNKLKAIKARLIPDLELSGGYAYQTKGVSDNGHYQQGAYAGVSLVNIPILYRYQPEIKNAQIEIEKKQLKYEDTKIDIIRNVTDAWEKYTIAKNNLNYYDSELLEDSKELLDASVENLEKKEIDITAFLVSKKLYLDLILGYHEALAEYYISYFELLKEINAESLDDLARL